MTDHEIKMNYYTQMQLFFCNMLKLVASSSFRPELMNIL